MLTIIATLLLLPPILLMANAAHDFQMHKYTPAQNDSMGFGTLIILLAALTYLVIS